MSYSRGWRPHIESALCLDLRRLRAIGAVMPNRTLRGALHWGENGGSASVGYCAALGADSGTLTLDYSHVVNGERKPVTCRIELETVPCHYGGLRWYFRCPYTHRRALKLYKWSGIDGFCHRVAIRPQPTYAIQRVSGSDRINAQRWALRRKLGDSFSDLFGEPCKPKWMRWRTFQRYLDRDAELEARDGIYLARMLGRMGVPGLDALR